MSPNRKNYIDSFSIGLKNSCSKIRTENQSTPPLRKLKWVPCIIYNKKLYNVKEMDKKP